MIEHETTATKMPKGEKVQVALGYIPEDPYAVRVTFKGQPPVTWVFGRELLAVGVRSLQGEGDVEVYPHPGCTQVTKLKLITGETALFHFQRADLVAFLEATYAVRPMGEESQRYTRPWFDAELLRLLDREESA